MEMWVKKGAAATIGGFTQDQSEQVSKREGERRQQGSSVSSESRPAFRTKQWLPQQSPLSTMRLWLVTERWLYSVNMRGKNTFACVFNYVWTTFE